jgi:hypothetical protein
MDTESVLEESVDEKNQQKKGAGVVQNLGKGAVNVL